MRSRGLTVLIDGLKGASGFGRAGITKPVGVNGGPTRSWIYFLHLAALSSLSLAQPIFDLLSQYPQFLVAHHAGRVEIWFLILLLCLVAPGSVAFAEWIHCRTFGDKYEIRRAGIALFVVPLALLVLQHLPQVPGVLLIGAAVAMAWLSHRAYRRYRNVRLYLSFLSPAILVVPFLFLTGASVRRITAPTEPHGPALADGVTDTPIVMVVFDELPVQSLLNRQGGIDSERFPSFAELSRQATWYRNAATVSHATQYAVPAILTGNRPEGDLGSLPNLAGHPNNLFTWLRNSHRLNVFESTTHLCPASEEAESGQLRRMIPLLSDLFVVYLHLVLPDDLAIRLPDVRHGWTVPKTQRGWRDHPVRQFEAFLDALRKDDKPSLNYLHVQLPHVPWIYLPSGKRYRSSWNIEVWNREESLAAQAFQRHLLQLGLADRLLGRLLAQLKASRLFDRSLIIVVSDHGVSFRPGASRRQITATNFKDLLEVPLLIKAPYQKQGRVSDRPTRTTDIFPSIANILGVPAPWPTEGIPVTETGELEDRDVPSIAAESFQFIGHKTTVCLDGAAIEVSQGGVWSLLDIVTEKDDKITFYGWAADMVTLELADSVLLFADGELVYRGMNRCSRPDVAKYRQADELEQSGFHLEFDQELFQKKQRVRGFTVFGERIYELAYPPGFPWSAEPRSMQEELHSQFEQPCSIDRDRPHSFLIDRRIGPDELGGDRGASESMKRIRRLAWNAGPDGLFQFGPAETLRGKQLDQLPVTHQSGLDIELDRPRLYERVDLDSDFIPAAIEGWISVADAEYVAVAVNGTLRAVAPIYEGPSGRRRFQAIVPETSFLNGANRIRVFVVAQTNEELVLLSPSGNR